MSGFSIWRMGSVLRRPSFLSARLSQHTEILSGRSLALTRLLIGMRAEETGVTPENTLAELGRRI